MKFKLLISIMLVGQFLSAQLFTEHPLTPPFEGVAFSTTSFSDFDMDGDEDVIIFGIDGVNVYSYKLYLNNGQGDFTEKRNLSLPVIEDGAIGLADVDGDNDEDFIISGSDEDFIKITKLYLNDGQGNFTVTNTPSLIGTSHGSITFSDIDGDNDQDVLITGLHPGGWATKLYKNDGQGNFSEVQNTSFVGVGNSSIEFSDIDGDNDQDLLITGLENLSSNPITKLYQNDGQGNFTEVINIPFEDLGFSSIAFADVDGDSDQDLLLTGENEQGDRFSNLYINDGQGNFTLQPNTPFEGINNSSVAFTDVDGDNDQDLVITGNYKDFLDDVASSKLYLNDGQGNFTEVIEIPFKQVSSGFLSFSDVDEDGDEDLLLTGKDDLFVDYSILYLNDGQGNFEDTFLPFDQVSSGSTLFSDIDGDGDLDVFISGFRAKENVSNTSPITKLFRNNGDGNFIEIPNQPFLGLRNIVGLDAADVDNDGDEDLILAGSISFTQGNATVLYLNDGQGNFTENPNTNFVNLSRATVDFADIDNDGDQDLLLTGKNDLDNSTTKLYINDGEGNFTQDTNNSFYPTFNAFTTFLDVDGDNDQDLLLIERNYAELYINDGQGDFSPIADHPFPMEMSNPAIDISDIDGDDDLDVLITGWDSSINLHVTLLYLNDGAGNFIEQPNINIEPIRSGSISFADMDGDGDNDLLMVGQFAATPETRKSIIYFNDGQGNFFELPYSPVEGLIGNISFGDIDGDNDLDLLVTGLDTTSNKLTRLYFNDFPSNNPGIRGYCYYDVNENQIWDSDEMILSNQSVQVLPNASISYPIIDGQYRFYVNNGSYQLVGIPSENWILTSPDTIDIDYQGMPIMDLNLGFIPTSEIPLIEPDIFSGPTRCSFDVPFFLSYQNNGTTFENGYFEFSLTDNATLQDALPEPDEVIGNKLYWNYTNLAPSEINNIRLILKMPDASNLGDTLDFVATTFLIDDNQDTIQNTVYHYNPVLNCAYDPNDKAALPAGVGDDNLTLFDSEFEYRIRFQNTGTDTAFTVRIEDDLDPNLDWNTFRPISASHPYEVDMDVESGRVTFLFRNILLPDSIVNEPLSHGFVKYKIAPLSNLSEETEITNEAAIFFDFNEPILTNMTLNTMVSMLTNTTEPLFSTELTVIPNPFQNSTIFRMKEIPGNRGTLNIYDTNGVLIFSESVTSNVDVTFRKEGLASGIYFYEVVSDQNVRVFSGRVVKY